MKYFFLLILSFTAFAFINTAPASAASGFEAGRIIDDSVFTDKSRMSVSDIQTFLNSKVPTCDTNGQQLSEFGGPDLNGDGKVQRWEWGKQNYNQTTFPCLRDYTVDGVSAAQLIYNASQTYSINPQVMIVLLQKEQGLITDTWPLNVQYRSATGYGCPDTAPCDAEYYGLKNQIKWAATMFRAILNDSPTWYTPYELGDNYIQYNPNASCGGSTVNIQNRSTQALYNYTPYQPSQAALDAGWGTVNCGAYGNRNFYLYFTDWFGSVTGFDIHENIKPKYNQVSSIIGGPLMSTSCDIRDNGCYQHFANGSIYWSTATGAQKINGGIRSYWSKQGSEWSSLRYPIADETNFTGGAKQEFQGGTIFWLGSNNKTLHINHAAIKTKFEQHTNLGPSSMSTACGIRDNGCYQHFANGSIYWSTATGAQKVGGGIKTYWNKQGSEWGKLGYPTADEVFSPAGAKQVFKGGTVYWLANYHGQSIQINQQAIGVKFEQHTNLGPSSMSTACGIRDNGCYQHFANGSIYWSTATGAQKVGGGIKTYWNKQGSEWGKLGYPTADETYISGGAKQEFQGGTVYWLGSDSKAYAELK